MATKRSASHVHPSRQDRFPDGPRRKRQKPNNAGPKSFKKAHPVNDVKNQIRSLKRLLERNDDLPATVRVEKERALQTAERELREVERAKKRSDLIGKYHKIRFFERQKAAKRLKRAQRELQACEVVGEERARLSQVVKDAEIDANYPQYFPLEQPYVKLFPQMEGDEDPDRPAGSRSPVHQQRKGDPVMWQRVKQCMADGTLNQLREGKLVEEQPEGAGQDMSSISHGKRRGDARPGHWSGKTEAQGKASATKAHGEDDEAGDGESDGGFFE